MSMCLTGSQGALILATVGHLKGEEASSRGRRYEFKEFFFFHERMLSELINAYGES